MSKKFMQNQEGVCPVCSDEWNLDYGDIQFVGDGFCYLWTCPKCTAKGKEYYPATFHKHLEVFDFDNNPAIDTQEYLTEEEEI